MVISYFLKPMHARCHVSSIKIYSTRKLYLEKQDSLGNDPSQAFLHQVSLTLATAASEAHEDEESL